MGKRRRYKGESKHHIVPRSRGGSSRLENIAVIQMQDHRDYHTLFENKLPEEIVEYLVNDYWNGNWSHVERAYKKRTFK